MNTFQKAWKHLGVINRHKIKVTKLLFKAGLYKRGILHDLSKYTPTEFFESIRFFTGVKSPIDTAKEIQGHSLAWLHHRGRNPHHYEYWIDYLDDGGKPLVIPFEYAMEMVCDYIAAGQVYLGDKWSKDTPKEFWANKKKTAKVHPKMVEFFDKMFDLFSEVGYLALNKRKAEKIYEWVMDPIVDILILYYTGNPGDPFLPKNKIVYELELKSKVVA